MLLVSRHRSPLISLGVGDLAHPDRVSIIADSLSKLTKVVSFKAEVGEYAGVARLGSNDNNLVLHKEVNAKVKCGFSLYVLTISARRASSLLSFGWSSLRRHRLRKHDSADFPDRWRRDVE